MSTAPPGVRQELARKAIHLTAVAAPIAYAAGIERTTLLVSLGTLGVIAVIVEVGRRASTRMQRGLETLVGGLFRAHEHASITGATWLITGMFAAAAVLPQPIAIATMWAVAAGDPAAALVGRTLGRIRYPANGKSLEGSLACLATTAAGAVFVAQFPILHALSAGMVAALVEWPRWTVDDNLRITLAVGSALVLLRMFAA